MPRTVLLGVQWVHKKCLNENCLFPVLSLEKSCLIFWWGGGCREDIWGEVVWGKAALAEGSWSWLEWQMPSSLCVVRECQCGMAAMQAGRGPDCCDVGLCVSFQGCHRLGVLDNRNVSHRPEVQDQGWLGGWLGGFLLRAAGENLF